MQETLDALTLSPADAAITALALEYASTIDRAAVIAAQLAKLPAAPDFEEELARLRAKVSAHSTMVDLGPKLQATLVELGATPKARAALPGKPDRGPRKLDQLRDGA